MPARRQAPTAVDLIFQAIDQLTDDDYAELGRQLLTDPRSPVQPTVAWLLETLEAAANHGADSAKDAVEFGDEIETQWEHIALLKQKPVGPVAAAVVNDTLPYLPPMVQTMVQVQALTGMRSGELCALRPIDLTTVDATWSYTPAAHKTSYRGGRRLIFVGPKAQALLRPLLPARLEERVFWRYTAGSYRACIWRACREHNLPRWSPHRLRHSFATAVRHRYGSLEPVQAALGHSELNTSEIYAARSDELAARVAAECG